VPALRLAQTDADRGLLDEERKQRIRDVIAELLDDLEAHEDKAEILIEASDEATIPAEEKTDDASKTIKTSVPDRWRLEKRVLCIPGRDLLGEAFALIVAQLVSKEGIGVRAEQSDALSMSRIFSLDTEDVGLVCLCFVGSATSAQIRYAARRLRRKMPDAFMLVSLIGDADIYNQDVRSAVGNGSIQTTLSGTLEEILKVAKGSGGSADRPNELRANELRAISA
jgi:hypothetical protein